MMSETKQARLVRRRRNIYHGGLTELWDVGDGHAIIVDFCPCTLTTGRPDTLAFRIDLTRPLTGWDDKYRWHFNATGGKAIRDLGYEIGAGFDEIH
jgi:hypothetical protein